VDLDALIREAEAVCAAQGVGGNLADAEALVAINA
jgi:hypothetical protein